MNESTKVLEYMARLEHPLKPEIEALRIIIKGANNKISERIKWNAPSYYYQPVTTTKTSAAVEDIVTFNHRATKHVHLVFHHPAIVHISSTLLEGDYKDRRMMYLQNMQEVTTHRKELENIMNELVEIIER